MIPVLFVPGLLCSAEVFAPQLVALWPYGPVTIASTLQGGSMEEMASAILATAPPRFALVGISMGGYIAFEIMRQAPERVLKLALLDTTARADSPQQTAQRRLVIEQAQSGDFEALAQRMLTAITHPSHRDDPALQAINARMARTIGLDGFIRQNQAAIDRVDSRPSLAAIQIPTLVLVGDKDPLTPPDLSQEIAAAIPGARLIVVPDSGHSSTVEQPEAVNRALVEWITS
jgi:pimeloyl-ACP methyl ester carboxylesterase